MLSRQNSKLIQAFIAIILFFSLGLVIKYWPDTVISFDQTIQESVRGQLPNLSTRFFKLITVIGNTVSQIAIAIMSVTFCYLKKWYPQARFIAVNAIISGICILSLKLIFQRVRPTLTQFSICRWLFVSQWALDGNIYDIWEYYYFIAVLYA